MPKTMVVLLQLHTDEFCEPVDVKIKQDASGRITLMYPLFKLTKF